MTLSIKDLLKPVPGAKVYKSFQEAMADIGTTLEKRHHDTVAKLKKKAADGHRRKGR